MEIDEYVSFLLGTAEGVSCVKVGGTLNVSHDMANRFLSMNRFTGKDLFEHARPRLGLSGGVLTVDDSVADKPYSSIEANDLVGMHWSGKHHKTVLGVNLVLLIYTDRDGVSLPVNFSLFDADGDMSKHDLMQRMVLQVLGWGLRPGLVTADSWYSSLDNLKFLRGRELGFMVGLAKNRIVSPNKGERLQVGQLAIPQEGALVHLKGFGLVKVFRTVSLSGDVRHYAVYGHGQEQTCGRQEFKGLKKIHWQVETTFRHLKQFCSLEKFFVRKRQQVTNHFFCALRGVQRLLNMHRDGVIETVGAIRKIIYRNALRDFINEFA